VANYQTDEALCLRVIDFSETSQVVTLLTRRHGLMGLLAKGSRKASKRRAGPIGGPLDLLCRGEAIFLPAREDAGLGTLTAWDVRDHHPQLRTQLRAFYAGQMVCEFTSLLLSPLDPHPELYDQLVAALELLAGAQGPRAVVAYMKCALTEAGYQPRLAGCQECQAAARPGRPMRFVAAAGGLWCADCPADKRAVQVDGGVILALARLPTPMRLRAQPPSREANSRALLTAARLLMGYARFIAEKPLKTYSLAAAVFDK
jgi:DNA repair protein RecO (recombination protein O)